MPFEPPDETGESFPSMRSKGDAAEDLAIDYLVALGYEILERNYQIPGGELDCIAKDTDGTLVFVEVKAAWSDSYGDPFFRITPSKQKKVIRTAKRWLYENDLYWSACRFDCISVNQGRVEHLKNAFIAPS